VKCVFCFSQDIEYEDIVLPTGRDGRYVQCNFCQASYEIANNGKVVHVHDPSMIREVEFE